MRVLRRLEQGRTLGRLWSRPVLAPPAWSRWWIVGLAFVAVVLAADTALSSRAVLTSALTVAVLLPGVWGRRGDALVVAPVAVLVAVASGLWNGWGMAYPVTAAVVGAAAVVAVVVALGRANAAAMERQLSLLRDLLALARSSSDVQAIVERLLDLLVPAMADVASLELLLDGRLRRLATRAREPGHERIQALFARQEVATGGARLVGEEDLAVALDALPQIALAADDHLGHRHPLANDE